MGLVVVAAGAVAAVVLLLSLVACATVALVQLVLFVTVRNTLLGVAVVGVYWFVASRQRRVARGFYSCTKVPGSAEESTRRIAATAKPPRHHYESMSKRNDAKGTVAAQEEEKYSEDTAEQKQTPVTDAVAEAADSGSSEAESCSDEAPVVATMSPATGPRLPLPPTASPTRLPDLRHRKWKHPSRSLPLAPPTKGESLLQENRKHESGSSADSPRRPERYSSPRSVAMEQKLMKSALESDGYWIGDFRLPPPALKRTYSSGANTPTRTTLTSTSSFRRAGSHV